MKWTWLSLAWFEQYGNKDVDICWKSEIACRNQRGSPNGSLGRCTMLRSCLKFPRDVTIMTPFSDWQTQCQEEKFSELWPCTSFGLAPSFCSLKMALSNILWASASGRFEFGDTKQINASDCMEEWWRWYLWFQCKWVWSWWLGSRLRNSLSYKIW